MLPYSQLKMYNRSWHSLAHWLPISHILKFKLFSIDYKDLYDLTTTYSSDFIFCSLTQSILFSIIAFLLFFKHVPVCFFPGVYICCSLCLEHTFHRFLHVALLILIQFSMKSLPPQRACHFQNEACVSWWLIPFPNTAQSLTWEIVLLSTNPFKEPLFWW